MPDSTCTIPLEHFTTFGDLLKYLRRRSGLTQRELSIAVGYSDTQISRLELNQRLPDPATVLAQFVPALGLGKEPEVVARLMALAAAVRREDAPAPGLPPFKGLLYFDEGDADLFFGREELTRRLLARIAPAAERPAAPRFLAVVGASGSGKSSVLRAGLVPALRWQPASAAWPIYVLTPTAHPLKALATALSREARSPMAVTTLAGDLGRDAHRLSAVLERAQHLANAAHVVLVVDQFEELFTLCRSEAERRVFVDNLLAAAWEPGGPAIVVIALRADFYSHCAQYPRLREALAGHQEYIGAMSGEELRQAIAEPARRGHWELEPGLIDLLLHDVGDEPGAMPLLSHALLETWQRRRGRELTVSGYLASGGVRGAIADTAEAVFNDQLDPVQQAIARRIFLRLTELGEGTQDTRRRARLSELLARPEEAPAVEAVLKTLADARLVITSEDAAEVAHEALIREWPLLRAWLTEDRESLRLHRHLTEASQEWEALGRDPGALYRGARLAQGWEWANAHPEELTALERVFLETSRTAAEREATEREAQRQRELAAAQRLAEVESRRAAEQELSNRRLRQRAVFLAVAFVVAGLLAVAAWTLARQARDNEQLAASRELAAASVSNVGVNPELSLLLALQAAQTAHTREAETALHRALPAQHVLRTLAGHSAMVFGVAYSPDGTRLATAGYDNIARVWDAATGQEVLALTGHHYWVNDVAFSPAGGDLRLATASADGTAIVWDMASGTQLLTLTGHNPAVKSGFFVGVIRVDFSRDGKRIATAGSDGTARVWDAATGQPLLSLDAHAGAVLAVAFSPDAARLATAHTDFTARVWNLATGQEVLVLREHTQAVQGIAFSPDGTRIATAGEEGTGIVWDGVSGEELLRLEGHSGGLWSVAFSPVAGDARIATSSYDGTARLWDSTSGQELLSLAGHGSTVLDVAFSPDGAHLATAGGDHTAKIWETAPGREMLTLAGPPGPMSGGRFTPDGKYLIAGSSLGGSLTVWDAVSGKVVLSRPMPGAPIVETLLSPEGTRLATGGMDGTVKVWDLALTEPQMSCRELYTLTAHTNWVFGMAFSPDGARLATVSFDRTMKVWDVATGRELLSLVGHTDEVWSVAFSPDGKYLATASRDATVRIWDAATGKELWVLPHRTVLFAVAFSPDGRQLATGGLDGTATLWDIATALDGRATSPQELFTLSRHNGLIVRMAYSPDGTRLATASFDSTTKVWDTATGQELFTLFGHTANVIGVNFSPNAGGSPLATIGFDGTARLYALRMPELLALAQSRVTRPLTADECRRYLHTATCP